MMDHYVGHVLPANDEETIYLFTWMLNSISRMGAWLPEGIALLVESVHGGEQQLVTADCPVFAAHGLIVFVGVYKC